jgi:cardiolipin synthase
MDYQINLFAVFAVLQVMVTIGISIRVIMNRPATGVALAWLVVVALVPYVGAAAYLMIGERRISPSRMARLGKLAGDFRAISKITVREGLTDVDWSSHPDLARDMNALGVNTARCLTFSQNALELISDTGKILQGIERDIEQATTSVLMEFYIWHEGGDADRIVDALVRASGRGVFCLVLVDALGGSAWWKGKQPARLREAGVALQSALPVGLFRSFVGRTDLRLHRKIVVVDGKIAWTGSMNLVDPKYFKQEGGFGQWIDAMTRLQGHAVLPLAAVLLGDWTVETGDDLRETGKKAGISRPVGVGNADVQVVPSGPGTLGNGLIKMMHAMLNKASTEVILTTPYLVPDDSLLWAIRGATGRGVNVKIVLPKTVDSFMTRHASNSYLDGLLNHGVEIYLYHAGLLHTKSIMVDGEVSMFGTVNLDMRSLWLNHEVSLFVYDRGFAEELGQLQRSYIDDSERLDQEQWSQRSVEIKFLENTMRLMSPLL